MLHRFAVLVACATFLLVVAGASVTSTGSGLAVPDWPLSYGTLFPPMEGGVLLEHGHRMIAGVVLILTTILCIWLFRSERRPWVRRLGLAALLVLLGQAVLGGLTVLLRLPTAISVGHAATASLFFSLIVCLAVVLSPGWREAGTDAAACSPVRGLSPAVAVAIYAQSLLGAVMRHTGAGLAIPDFPLSFGGLVPPAFPPPVLIHYAHRLGAVAVTLLVIAMVLRVEKHRREVPTLRRPALLLAGTLALQLLFGALTIWSRRAPLVTVAHVALGAAMLAASLVVTLRSQRIRVAPAEERRAPVSAASAAVAR